MGFQLQFLEADHLDENKNNVYKATGNRIKMGVEVDKYDRPVAYHLYKDHPYDRVYLAQAQHIRVHDDGLIRAYLPTSA